MIGGLVAGVSLGLLIVVPALWLLFRDRGDSANSTTVAAADTPAAAERTEKGDDAESAVTAGSSQPAIQPHSPTVEANESPAASVASAQRRKLPTRRRSSRSVAKTPRRGPPPPRIRIADPVVKEGASAAGLKLMSQYGAWRSAPPAIEIPPPPEVERMAKEQAEAIAADLQRAYAEFGTRNPNWDDPANEVFSKESRRWWPEGSMAGCWDDLAARVVATGCDDPLVLRLCGMGLLRDAAFAEAKPLLASAATAFASSKHPRRFGWTLPVAAADAAARSMDTNKANREFESVEPVLSALFSMAEQAAAEIEDRADRRRMFLDDLAWVEERLLPVRRAELRERIVQVDGLDDWTRTMITSGGVVRDIVFDRKAKYEARMRHRDVRAVRAARVELLNAWEAHPERPEAAASLIVATAALGGAAGEPPRFWFDQAVQAEFDYFPAYDLLLASQRFDLGGTLYDMYEFGEECLGTERFDTPVPTLFEIALQRMRAAQRREINTGQNPATGGTYRNLLIRPDYRPDPKEVYRSPGALENLQRLVAGRIQAGADKDESRRLRVLLAVRAWESGDRAEAARLTAELRDPADAAVKIRFSGSRKFLLEEWNLNLRSYVIDLEQVRSELAKAKPAKPVPTGFVVGENGPLQVSFPGIRSAEVSRDGKRLLTASHQTSKCLIVDLETRKPLREFDGPTDCHCAIFSPDELEVVSGWRDG